MEARQIAAELLEMNAWRHPQILIGSRIVDHLELAREPAFEIGRDVPRPPILYEEVTQPRVPKLTIIPRSVSVPIPLLGTGTSLETSIQRNRQRT